MNKLEIFKKRKSVREYLDKEISYDIKSQIISAALEAPTAGNMQLYSIIDVCDYNILEELSIICDNQKFIKNSKMTLVFLVDTTKWYKIYKKYDLGDDSPSVADYFLGFSDALIAAQNACIMASLLDIGSCYIGDVCEQYEKVVDLLKLPKNVLPCAMLVFGYPTEAQVKRNKPNRFNKDFIVFKDHYIDYSLDECEKFFIDKIASGSNLDVDFVKKTKTYVKAIYNNKQGASFFLEMNRSLKVMLKDYFNDDI